MACQHSLHQVAISSRGIIWEWRYNCTLGAEPEPVLLSWRGVGTGQSGDSLGRMRWLSHQGWHAPLACVAVSLCLGLASAVAKAGEVVVVRSSDAAPYSAAGEALQADLEKNGLHVRSVLLKDFDIAAASKVTDQTTAFVAVGSEAAVALQQRIPASHPLVYCMVADPASLGLASGRATYGIDVAVPLASQFALIAEALPKIRTLGALYRSDSKEGVRTMQAAKAALPNGWAIETVALNESGSAAKAIDALLDRKIDLVWTAPDASLYDQNVVRALLLAAVRRQVPVFGYSKAFVKAGALLGVGIDPSTQGHQAAKLLERVVGGKAGPAAVLAPQFEVAVNLVVADRIAVSVAETVVRRAQMVVKGK